MSKYRTPWSKTPSSFPSDRLPPSNAQRPKPSSTGKGKQAEVDIPKSREVRRLEELRDGLRDALGKADARDPKGGCYCQARNHALSTYTPICRICGLVLCTLNLPYYACPHCRSPLLSSQSVETLISSVEQSIADTLAREEYERDKAAEEARRAAGAFPVLASGASSSSMRSLNASNTSLNVLDAHPVNQPHKVLSLNSKAKRVTVTSYTKTPHSSQGPISKLPEEPIEPEPTRVPRPTKEVVYSSKPPDSERPWMNTKSEPVTYIPPPKNVAGGSSRAQSKRKGKQAAGSQREDGKENSNA